MPDLRATLDEFRRAAARPGRLLASVPGVLSPIYRDSWLAAPPWRRPRQQLPPALGTGERSWPDLGWRSSMAGGMGRRPLRRRNAAPSPNAAPQIAVQQATATTWTIVAELIDVSDGSLSGGYYNRKESGARGRPRACSNVINVKGSPSMAGRASIRHSRRTWLLAAVLIVVSAVGQPRSAPKPPPRPRLRNRDDPGATGAPRGRDPGGSDLTASGAGADRSRCSRRDDGSISRTMSSRATASPMSRSTSTP